MAVPISSAHEFGQKGRLFIGSCRVSAGHMGAPPSFRLAAPPFAQLAGCHCYVGIGAHGVAESQFSHVFPTKISGFSGPSGHHPVEHHWSCIALQNWHLCRVTPSSLSWSPWNSGSRGWLVLDSEETEWRLGDVVSRFDCVVGIGLYYVVDVL